MRWKRIFHPSTLKDPLPASLCIASARAFGASLEIALNTAVAVEILHNAFLVHDDVEDDSEQRRGRPTMHLLHGVPIAVNVGDALAVLASCDSVSLSARPFRFKTTS